MSEALRPRVKYVIGPDGIPLTIADLPPTSKRFAHFTLTLERKFLRTEI